MLVSKCQKCEVLRTQEENNVLFLKSLNDEWLQLSISLQTNEDVGAWTLHVVYGTLAA